MTKGYIDYNNEEVSIYERPREERELNVVENIKTRDERYAALPKVNEEPVCVATLEKHIATAKAELVSPDYLILRSESGKEFVVTVSDEGALQPADMITTSEELLAAIKAGGTITLYTDIVGNGIVVPEGSNFVLNMNGHTYTVIDPTVGSAGTETNGFQLLKDSTITIKDGSILAGTDSVKILIQNYSNLTLENVVLDGTGSANCMYVMSNNNGDVTIKGNTHILAPEGACALDAYYWSKYYESVHVTVETTGLIQGRVEYTNDGLKTEEEIKANSSLTIVSGRFNEDPIAYVAEGSTVTVVEDEYVVAKA